MYESYRDRVAFLFVYIHEAHADDEWQLDSNRTDGIIYEQPTTLALRREIEGLRDTRCSAKSRCQSVF